MLNRIDYTSYSLMRTNPKLSGNIKLVTNQDDIWLESFNANETLSGSSFKAFKVDGKSTYDRDVHTFLKKGTVPNQIIFDSKNQYDDNSIGTLFKMQYESMYWAGSSATTGEVYNESFSTLAPLWLDKKIPNYFVVFRAPVEINKLNRHNTFNEAFYENLLKSCTLIKSFDLTENTKIGKYIRAYKNQPSFPRSPIYVNWTQSDKIQWSGISIKHGGFMSSSNYVDEELLVYDKSMIESDEYLTLGFERNSLLVANLLNLEFLFDDEEANLYTINRYFGLYVDEIPGFDCTVDSIDNTSNDSIIHITQKPTYNLDKLGFHFIKNKENKHYKVDSILENAIKIKGSAKASEFKDISKPVGYVNAKTLDRSTIAFVKLAISKNIPHGVKISFNDTLYDGSISEIFTINTNNNIIGSDKNEFNGTGLITDISNSCYNAIKYQINNKKNSDIRTWFDVGREGNNIYILCKKQGTRFNRLNIIIDYEQHPELKWAISTFPDSSSLANENKKAKINFIGGSDDTINGFIIDKNANNLEENSFLVEKNGVTKLTEIDLILPYIYEPVYNAFGDIIKFKDIDKFSVVKLKEGNLKLNKFNQIPIYKDEKIKVGKFSLYPIYDFDFDFYNESYSKLNELDLESREYKNYKDTPTTDYINEIKPYLDVEFANLWSHGTAYAKSEYERYEENALKEYALKSRTQPYIVKWGMYNGLDVRFNPYRLNTNLSFGLNNFAPYEKQNKEQNLFKYTFAHEWLSILGYPDWVVEQVDEFLKLNKNYIDSTNIDSDNIVELLQSPDENVFDKLFIDTQPKNVCRYSIFSLGSSDAYSETFLRGVKLKIKNKVDGILVKDAHFTDYKFGCILIKTNNSNHSNTIKVVKNNHFKTITFIYFIDIKNENDYKETQLDRFTLYNIRSKFDTDNKYTQHIINTQANAISNIIKAANEQSYNVYSAKGNFIIDLTKNSIGLYNNLHVSFTYDDKDYTLKFEGITNVVKQSHFVCKKINLMSVIDGVPVEVQVHSLVDIVSKIGLASIGTLKQILSDTTAYTVVDGSRNALVSTFAGASYESLFNSVNNNTNIEYIPDTYRLEIEPAQTLFKSQYINVVPDSNKPTIFTNLDIIGYDRIIQNPKIIPLTRHSGWYSPVTTDVLPLNTPGLDNNLDLMLSSLNVKHPDFGVIKNLIYHKVNRDALNILEINSSSGYKSQYPLINEIGWAKKDFNLFKTSLDVGYYQEHVSKLDSVEIEPGETSLKEIKSFFGSKMLALPQSIILDSFVKERIVVIDNGSNYEIKLDLGECLVDYIAPQIIFNKLNKREREAYVRENCIDIFRLAKFELYSKIVGSIANNEYYDEGLSLDEKINLGYVKRDNMQLNFNKTNTEATLIYNKIPGYAEKFSFRIFFIKK